MKKMSKNEEKVYNYMKHFLKEKGYCHTLYEISNFMGKPYNTAKNYIDTLKEKGLVKSVHTKKRYGVWEYVLL